MHKIDINGLKIDPTGRVILSEQDIRTFEGSNSKWMNGGGAAGGSTNSFCINATSCNGTGNSRCQNQASCSGSMDFNCKRVNPRPR